MSIKWGEFPKLEVTMKNCFYPADILLPDFSVTDGSKWAAVACDQFTSEPEYWEEADRFVGDAPSTLRLILPEVYLDEGEARTPLINRAMEEYLQGVLVSHPDSLIYVERTQASGGVRRGLVGAVDLECYDYKKGSDSLIRATEGTVIERIPPRVAVRRGAAVELPHVMLLIDDPERTVIEPLIGRAAKVAYDFELMLDGGHVKGYFVERADYARIASALEALADEDRTAERYGEGLAPLLFAVGDGNHSLATAKATYEELKATVGKDAAACHPARYALCEVVNLHDSALEFEPIYRVMFGIEPERVVEALEAYAATLDGRAEPQRIEYIYGETRGELTVNSPIQQLPVGTLQAFIDGYIKQNPDVTVDYIHGVDSTEKLAARDGAIGFIFEGMAKDSLFKTVMLDGALPRKTFSMGHARDKRFYLEARKIKN